ncbi:hypothetical protein BH10PLA1_BH10PLA1_04420 [soil metagenome]
MLVHVRSIVCVAVVALATMGASPATKPSSTPVIKKPDPTMTVVENKTFLFHLAVPKVWKIRQAADKLTVYNVPGQSGPTGGGLFVIIAMPVGHEAKTLAEVIDIKKKALVKDNKSVKITLDKESELAGQPAWSLQYDVPVTAKVVTTVNGKAEAPKSETIVQRCMKVVGLKDGVMIDLTYVCEESVFAARSKLAKKVIDSFAWADDTAAADKTVDKAGKAMDEKK